MTKMVCLSYLPSPFVDSRRTMRCGFFTTWIDVFSFELLAYRGGDKPALLAEGDLCAKLFDQVGWQDEG